MSCSLSSHFVCYELIENKRGSRIKAGCLYSSPIFSTQMNVSLPFESHIVAYQCKALSNATLCESMK